MAWIAGLTTVADFWLWRFLWKVRGLVIGERIQWLFADVTPGPLKRFDSGDEMTRDEHQL